MPRFQRSSSRQKPLPSSSERSLVDDTLERFHHEKDALLEVLNAAQNSFGYLSEELISYVADQLNLPESQVYGVATFYEMYSFEPLGETHLMVCADPACAIAGAEDVYRTVCSHAGLSEDNPVSEDGKVSVHKTSCLGLCDQAPVALAKNKAAYVNLSADNVDALLPGKADRVRLNVAGEPRVLTRLINELDPLDLEAHQVAGTFAALKKALEEMTPNEVIEEVKTSGLSGRGGAGFPTGLKWQFTREAPGMPKYVICNFDESEPGTFKDRVLVEGDPFRIIEGLMLAAYAIGSEQGYIFVRGEYPEATEILYKALDILRENNLLGDNILGSGFKFDISVRRGAGAYICGEETALFEAIEGNRGHPRHKPPYPTTSGLFGLPTAINNVETLAIVPDLILNGGEWFKQWGTEKSVGLKLFCLSGHVKQPGVVEAPFGLTVRELIEQFGGGFEGEPQAILMGGAAGGFLHPDKFDTPLTHEDLKSLNAPIGSGVVMVFNQTVDLWHVLEGLAHFFVHETCGRCVPCRVGTRQVYAMLNKINMGQGTMDDLAQMQDLGRRIKSASVCALGVSAANPVLTVLDNFDVTP